MLYIFSINNYLIINLKMSTKDKDPKKEESATDAKDDDKKKDEKAEKKPNDIYYGK